MERTILNYDPLWDWNEPFVGNNAFAEDERYAYLILFGFDRLIKIYSGVYEKNKIQI